MRGDFTSKKQRSPTGRLGRVAYSLSSNPRHISHRNMGVVLSGDEQPKERMAYAGHARELRSN